MPSVAFAVNVPARLLLDPTRRRRNYLRRRRLRFMLRTGQSLSLSGLLSLRFDGGISTYAGSQLPGTLASPRTGLAPAGQLELHARLRHVIEYLHIHAPGLLDAHTVVVMVPTTPHRPTRGWVIGAGPAAPCSAVWKAYGVDSCDECGFVYDDHVAPAVVSELASLGPRLASRLHQASGDAEGEALLRLRPAPRVWSALEYACHVRDVLIAQRERLLLALVEDCPGFAPIYREQRAALARYAESDPAQVAEQVNAVAALVAHTFAGIDQAGWRRECIYNFPTPAKHSLAWLAAHTLHEGEHHLQDFDRVMLQVTDVTSSP